MASQPGGGKLSWPGLRGSPRMTGGQKCHNRSPCECAEYMCIFQKLRNIVINTDPG